MPLKNRTRRHILYAAIITLIAIIAGYKGVLPVFRSHLMRYLDIGDNRFGLLFSIGSVTGLCSVLFGGHLIDRWGPRRMIRTSLSCIGFAMLIVAFGGSRFAAFAIAVGISGACSFPLAIAVSAYLGKLFPRHRRRVISLNMASTSVGGVMFPIVAEGLLYLSEKYESVTFAQVLHYPFMLTGALLICGSFIYRNRQTQNEQKQVLHESVRRPERNIKDFFLTPRALMLAFLIALHGTADSTLHVWMARFLESDSFPVELIPPGVVLSGYSLAYVFARMSLAALPDRIGRRVFLVLPGLIGGGIMIAGLLSQNYMLTAGCYILGAFCWSAEYPAMVSTLLQNDSKRFGFSMAVSGVLSGLSMFFLVNLIGMLVQHLTETMMWAIMIIPAALFPLVGIGGLLWVILFDRQGSVNEKAASGDAR